MSRTIAIALFLLTLPLLAACELLTGPERAEQADTLALARHFVAREIPARLFALKAYERVRMPGQVAAVYIEGDGLAWLSRTRISDDPTPINPVALKLAARDVSPNVIYLGRPCQFTKGAGCEKAYWTNKRFSPEVIAAMSAALDDIKARYKIFGFNLVGFSGGGAVAALLSAQRSDILSLRTVAGNLDTDAFTRHHRVSPLSGSLNPADIAQKILPISQKHFSGVEDDIMPREIGDSFVAKANRPDCLILTIVEGASHETGWEEKWPELLEQPLEGGCQ